ncbi:MAG: hypothetical protein CMJ25_10495 [Phycisphaerae bacterium]|nr:hypothetical protein [Phycisphaerae bacterium]
MSLDSVSPTSFVVNVSLEAFNDTTPEGDQMFQIYNADTSQFELVENIFPTTTQVTVTGLTQNTSYRMRIRKRYAFNGTIYQIFANIQEVTNYEPVQAVSNISFANTTTTSTEISWTRNYDGLDTNVLYQVVYFPTGTTDIKHAQSSTKTDVLLTGLIHNTTYDVFVNKLSFINTTYTSATFTSLNGAEVIAQSPTLYQNEIRLSQADISFDENDNGTASSISFTVIYLDDTNQETISTTIPQNATGFYSHTITGLSPGNTYRVVVRKDNSISPVFSNTETIQTPASLVLPIAPTLLSATTFNDRCEIEYDPRSIGDATVATIKFYKAQLIGSDTYETYIQYPTTRDVSTDQSVGTFSLDGLESGKSYSFKVEKTTNLNDTSFEFPFTVTTSGGGGGGGGFPPIFPPGETPKQPDDDDPDQPPSEIASTFSYQFSGGSLATLDDESSLTHIGFVPSYYLNDPDTARLYSYQGQLFQSNISASRLITINLSKELHFTFKISVASETDNWRVKIGNLQVTSLNSTTIKLTIGTSGVTSNDYSFTYTKPSNLFNEYVFSVDTFGVNLYVNGDFVDTRIMFNFELTYTNTTIEVENTDASYSLFEEISINYGTRKEAVQIANEYNNRYSYGQQYGIFTNPITITLNADNTYTVNHRVEFEHSPSLYFKRFSLNGISIDNTVGSFFVENTTTYTANGTVQSAQTTNVFEPISHLQAQDFTTTITINNTELTTIVLPTITRDIYDETTTLHKTNDFVFPTLIANFLCKKNNNFNMNYFINSFYNGVYRRIDEFNTTVFLNDTETVVSATLTGDNYGSAIRVFNATNLNVGNAYTQNTIENGLITSIISNGEQLVTNSVKTMYVNTLPFPTFTVSYDGTDYTAQVLLNTLVGTETDLTLEIWMNDLEIQNINVVNNTGGLLTNYTTETYETGFTPYRLVVTGETITNNPITFTFRKINPNQFFSNDPFRAIIYDLGTQHLISGRVFNYKEVFPSIKEYEFYYTATVVNGSHVDLDLRLIKSNEPMTNASITITFQTDTDFKRIISSATSGINVSFTQSEISLTTSTPFGSGQTDVSLCVFRLQANSAVSYNQGVNILPSHISTYINTYTETDSNFTYITTPPSFQYQVITTMEVSSSTIVGNRFTCPIRVRKTYDSVSSLSFKVVFDNRRLKFTNIEFVRDISVPITETETVVGNITTIVYELLDPTNIYNTYGYSPTLFTVYAEGYDAYMSFDDTHFDFEFLEMKLRSTPSLLEIVTPTVSRSSVVQYQPDYQLIVNPVPSLSTTAKSRLFLQCSVSVSDRDAVDSLEIAVTVLNTTKLNNITGLIPSSISGNTKNYIINLTSTTPVTGFQFFVAELEQKNRTIGFDESHVQVDLINITYKNLDIQINSFFTNSWAYQIPAQVWATVELDNSLKLLEVTLSGYISTNNTVEVIYDSTHHDIHGSVLLGSDPYGWGSANTKRIVRGVYTFTDTFMFDTVNIDIEADTLYYVDMNNIRVFVNPNTTNYVGADTIYTPSFFQSHVKLYALNPVINNDIYSTTLCIGKERLGIVEYMEIESVYNSSLLQIRNIIEKTAPSQTTKVGNSLVYNNSPVTVSLLGGQIGSQPLYKIAKIQFNVLDPTASASSLQVSFNLKSTNFIINAPYFGVSSDYFLINYNVNEDTLTHLPTINLRLQIYQSGIYLNIKLFSSIGYSGIGGFTTRVDLLGVFNVVSIQENTSYVTYNEITATSIEFIYTDNAPNTSVDRGEIELAHLTIANGESEVSDSDFEHFVPTSVLGYNFTYSKNDFSL